MPEPVRIFVSHHHSPEEDAFTARLGALLRKQGESVVANQWEQIDQLR